jgi:hypothetical protein
LHQENRDARGTTGCQANKAVYQQDTIEALANLATATSHDLQAVSTLTTNSALAKELNSVNDKLVTALLANTKLTAQLASQQPNNDTHTDA